ncbi:MAG: hypothetical protein EB055_02575 [Micrococcales bacterium]|nr:hypothetical protein [Micrococcales bacterium]
MRFAETLMRMTEEGGVELPFPAFFFGLIAFTIFTLLVIVTWSYRRIEAFDRKKENWSHGWNL